MSDNFVFILSPEELTVHFSNWPLKVWVAVRVENQDDIDFVLFREEEKDKVFPGIVGNLPVVPKQDGYPTTKIMFSTESKIINLVSEEQELVDAAHDYSLNFDWENSSESEKSPVDVDDSDVDVAEVPSSVEEVSHSHVEHDFDDVAVSEAGTHTQEADPVEYNDSDKATDEEPAQEQSKSVVDIAKFKKLDDWSRNSIFVESSQNGLGIVLKMGDDIPFVSGRDVRYSEDGLSMFMPYFEGDQANNFRTTFIPDGMLHDGIRSRVGATKQRLSYTKTSEGIIVSFEHLPPHELSRFSGEAISKNWISVAAALIAILSVGLITLSLFEIGNLRSQNEGIKTELASIKTLFESKQVMDENYIDSMRKKIIEEGMPEN